MTVSPTYTDIQKRSGVELGTVISVIDTFAALVQEKLQHGEQVAVDGFGVFFTKDVAPRTITIPRTGERRHQQAKKKPAFQFDKQVLSNFNPANSSPPPPPPPVATTPPPPPPSEDKFWYVAIPGKDPVKVPHAEIKEAISSPDTQVWRQDIGWKKATEVPELAKFLK